jgi:hypothetical protein
MKRLTHSRQRRQMPTNMLVGSTRKYYGLHSSGRTAKLNRCLYNKGSGRADQHYVWLLAAPGRRKLRTAGLIVDTVFFRKRGST